MRLALRISEIADESPSAIGGKAHSLARMLRAGLRIPDGLCIPVGAYQEYVASTGLRDRILATLFRKRFADMRWEEIWDVSLRVRNLFLKTPLPPDLRDTLHSDIAGAMGEKAAVVRSSAPGEDAAETSFAGLHESFVNIVGAESILERVRLVWASLWSDRALLYRQEIGLEIGRSAMAVLVQEMVAGERSGITFTHDPADNSQGIVEAVHGLNQGLVDGSVEPDRWTISRRSCRILNHRAAQRDCAFFPISEGVRSRPLSGEESSQPPLNPGEVISVYGQALDLETLFDAPQDVEWTFRSKELLLLQARPITRIDTPAQGDARPWYLSLRRSLDNLKVLRARIEGEHLPAMAGEADGWAGLDVSSLPDEALADEVEYRLRREQHWGNVYREDFIPFAHGMRLFGQFYNDVLRPADPYEFMDLLTGADLLSKQRNAMMKDLAEMLRRDPALAESARGGGLLGQSGEFGALLDQFVSEFGDTSWGDARLAHDREDIIQLLLEMARVEARPVEDAPRDRAEKERRFLAVFDENRRSFARELLELGRASYRLRDNDNVFLGRVKGQALAAVSEGQRRIQARGSLGSHETPRPEDLPRALRDPSYRPRPMSDSGVCTGETEASGAGITVRQAVGQPAGAGIGVGVARVVTSSRELFAFKAGEVLVCDAIDPNMTFVVPLAAAIVERRGGMLIHGAIIAREYGVPCVTGVPDATTVIHTGARVSVDGFLGIVTIG